jgi:hypothetical protein
MLPPEGNTAQECYQISLGTLDDVQFNNGKGGGSIYVEKDINKQTSSSRIHLDELVAHSAVKKFPTFSET